MSGRADATDPPGSWLLHDDQVLASLEIASSRAARRKGLIGRDGFDAALLLPGCRWVHTIGMRFPIDVAYCDRQGRVLRITTLVPNRIDRPCLGARQAVEAAAGAFTGWSVHIGDVLEFR